MYERQQSSCKFVFFISVKLYFLHYECFLDIGLDPCRFTVSFADAKEFIFEFYHGTMMIIKLFPLWRLPVDLTMLNITFETSHCKFKSKFNGAPSNLQF